MRDELFFFWTLSLVNWHGATSGNRIYCTGFMLLVYSTHIFMFWPSDTHTLTTGAVCNGFLLLVFPGAIFDKTRCYPPMLKWQVVIHVDTHTHRERERKPETPISLSQCEKGAICIGIPPEQRAFFTPEPLNSLFVDDLHKNITTAMAVSSSCPYRRCDRMPFLLLDYKGVKRRRRRRRKKWVKWI